MPKTSFSPAENGFHFANGFVNKIIDTSFGKIESRGRCGGMAFASLDYYFAKVPVPAHEPDDFPNRKYPPDGSLLGDYIYMRAVHSFLTLSAYKFVDWTLRPDRTYSFRKSVFNKSRTEEFAKLRKSIDSSKPAVLGLIAASKASDIFKNHQVVAYGYEYDAKEKRMDIYIYDSNSPNREVVLHSQELSSNFKASNGFVWRGFFVQDYHFKRPEYIDLITSERKTKNNLIEYTIKNTGQFPSRISHLKIPSVHVASDMKIMPGEEKTIVL